MTTYIVLQVILLSYSIMIILFGLWSMITEIKHSFKTIKAKQEIFNAVNKLHGKKYILIPFLFWSYAALISWLLLALPQIDNILCLDLISSYNWTEGFITWFGNFRDMPANLYFVSLLFNIVAVIGSLVCVRMANILITNYIHVSLSGRWGSNEDLCGGYNG